MSESTTEAQASEAPETPAQEQQAEQEDTDWQAEATRLREELSKARKWEDRAKENRAKVEQYEREKLPEAERAAAEAEERGRKAAASEFGQRLATSEIRAAAATAGADLTGVFDYLDLARFVDENGEPDEKAIKSFVAGLPAKDDGKRRAPRPDQNQGRSSSGSSSTADQFAASVGGLL